MRFAAVTSVSLLAFGITLAHAGNGDPPQRVLVKVRVALTADVASDLAGGAGQVSFVWPEIGWFAASATSSQIRALASDPRVEAVASDRHARLPDVVPLGSGAASGAPVASSSAPLVPWSLDMVDANGSGYDGTGVTVAVVDSGLPLNWDDYLPEANVDVEHAAGFSPMGRGSNHLRNMIKGQGGYLGLSSHGLAVSGVIVGFQSALGPIRGAAPGARILPVRVTDQFDFAWDSWCAGGILYVADLKRSGELPGPVIINFSFQGDPSDLLADAVEYAIDQGVLFVTVAGNSGPAAGSISLPGSLPRAITVGMAGWVQEASFEPDWIFDDVPEDDATQLYVPGMSGRESDPPAVPTLIDVLAPGSGIYAPYPAGPGFSENGAKPFLLNFPHVGTSFAAPLVAGIVAQMLERNPALTQAQAEAILRDTALPIPPDPDGVVTPIFVPDTPFGPGSMFWGPWDANATGAGLTRGVAAVAATPLP